MNDLLGDEWVSWPAHAGYWWVVWKPGMQPELKHIVAQPTISDTAISVWDCPGIGRRELDAIGDAKFRKVSAPNVEVRGRASARSQRNEVERS